ncbi:MAG: 1-acyl-sn-glycerol-3-phosphate acyltransferase [Clostridiales bacterium]|nr:1-acyl-sn-glycerol-3-phosphate acyltransferase [Clostridiales bacterium]
MAKKKWVKARHGVVRGVIRPFVYAFAKTKVKLNKKDLELEKNQPCLVCYNHQTNFDPFLVGLTMGKRKFYYVASEHIFSKGFVSSLLKYFIAPIPFMKSGVNTSSIMNCGRVVREGASIVISPEGNRTYTGETTSIKDTIVKFVRFLKVPLVLINIKGNYSCRPRWAKSKRKGEVSVEPVKIIKKEEYDNLTDDELLKVIKEKLYVNESFDGKAYKNKKKNNAEYLERFLYVCPNCGIVHFKSKGSSVTCSKCGLTANIDDYKKFSGVSFETLKDWGDYQQEFIKNFDDTNEIIKDTVNLYLNEREKGKKKLMDGETLSLYIDKMLIKDKEFNFNDISGMDVVGDNAIYFHFENKTYRIDGGERFNAIKYVDFYNKFKGEN